MRRKTTPIVRFSAGCALMFGSTALAQSFSIDDNPLLNGLGVGVGAEDEFGLSGGLGLAPSPSIPFTVGGDGSMISPKIGGVEHIPGFLTIDAFSTNYHGKPPTPDNPFIRLSFSVDRITTGLPGSASLAESAVHQQPGDIYTSTAPLMHPGFFAGSLGPGPFAGVLPSAGVGGSNVLTYDESTFGLLTPIGVVPPGVPVPPPATGSHDNIDAFDARPVIPTPVGGVYATASYFAVTPDDAASFGGSAADLFVTPAGSPVSAGLYAPAPAMGLDFFGLNTDSIDALIMFDAGDADNANVPGADLDAALRGAAPGSSYALFSLAPGSTSLAMFGLSAGDVFFTDFSGSFGVYAFDTDLGLLPGAPGVPFGQQTNVDALTIIPEPGSLALIGVGAAMMLRRRRQV